MQSSLYQNDLIAKLLFIPKENSVNTYQKKYSKQDNYTIEIDLEQNCINFGSSIFFNDSKKSTQKITKPEDLVVLECVDRLLTKGYNPENIILEKVYPSGHGTSGRLDILVTHDDTTAYMMIECKTWAKEFDKAFTKLNKDGGQLFTYFQQDKDAEVLVLYASELIDDEIKYINQIVKIEEEYKTTSNVKDFYDRWNKTPKNNGVFDSWTTSYNYKSKALTPKELVEITSEDSSKIFNRFMEILRHNVVSDKPNAFSKIFTLFLCKIMDEKDTKSNEELGFQWIEGIDTHISFQKRLTDLYQKGMKEFLDKEVSDLSDAKFEEKFGNLDNSIKEELLEEFTKIRLQKNNEFAIKDVFDQDTFEENAIVVKEVVELLQNYQIRYTKKQQFLSDFFELLLTTGLKQEVGQFFTPVPVAKFIIRSIPFDKIIENKLSKGVKDELLPNVIDYAVGSGHFITEAMDEIQKYINITNPDEYIQDTTRKLKSWKEDHFDWAYDYVYGIEKDYRLVKTAKVGCYLHGDGLAKVIHGDGLANFTDTKEYKGKLAKRDKNYYQDNKQFDLVISNPPYSVSAFKNISKKFNKDDFELYEKLTDQSSEIEALFIERTKQLLKDGGIAGIILPSSILSNGGIYTKTREIIFKYFDVISITELGSNTFMATGTNTVVLFLRRKNNMEHKNIQASVLKLFDSKKDITINGIENPLSKYINHVWEDISIDDYFSLLEKSPNDKIKSHELYQEYDKKIDNFEKIIELEKEKLLYFIMAYPQKITIIKTGEKKKEKRFLGYEFSARRGKEGIHPVLRDSTIDECTRLYDDTSYSNNLKANSYIYSAFNGEFKEIDESLKENISYIHLVDMMIFDRVDFEKSLSLSVKIKIKSKWRIFRLGDICDVRDGTHGSPKFVDNGYPLITSKNITNNKLDLTDVKNISQKDFDDINKRSLVENGDILYAMIGTIGFPVIVNTNVKFAIKNVALFKFDKSEKLNNVYLKELLNHDFVKSQIEQEAKGNNRKFVSLSILRDLKIPLPPKKIQEKIINEIKALEKVENKNKLEIKNYRIEIKDLFLESFKTIDFENLLLQLDKKITKIKKRDAMDKGKYPIISQEQNVIVGYSNESDPIDELPLIIFGDHNCFFKYIDFPFFQGADGIKILKINPKLSNAKFLYYYLKDLEIENSEKYMRHYKYLRNKKIPLPSIEEQKEIVLKIEAIEKKIEIEEEELANIPQKKENILERYLK